MRKQYLFLIVLTALFSLALILPAQAATINSASVTVDAGSPYGGKINHYIVDFTVASSTEIQTRIRLIFPAGFSVAGATATSTAPSTTINASYATSTVSGQEITLWLTGGSIGVINTEMRVQVDGIQSPYEGGTYTLGL